MDGQPNSHHQSHPSDELNNAVPPHQQSQLDDGNLPEVVTAATSPWTEERDAKYVDENPNLYDNTSKYIVPETATYISAAPPYEKPLPPIKEKKISSLTIRRRTLWILVAIAFVIVAVLAGTVGGVLGSRNSKSSSNDDSMGEYAGASGSTETSDAASSSIAASTTSSSHKTTHTPTTTLLTQISTSITESAAATSTGVCIGGTVADGETENYLGLCKFCCSYGYCPPGPCSCTSYGTEDDIAVVEETNTTGCPLEGESDGYLGLCSYACNHGYCPDSACTTECDSS